MYDIIAVSELEHLRFAVADSCNYSIGGKSLFGKRGRDYKREAIASLVLGIATLHRT